MAPSVRPSARAISRLSMPSAKRMISASRRSSGSSWTPSGCGQLVATLDQRLGVVRRRDDPGVLDRRLRPARAVAVEVRGEVVGDADQPRPQRAAVGLALRALEVAVGLQERLLREVLGVVVVANPVVRVGVDVAQVAPGRAPRTPRRAAPWASAVALPTHVTPTPVTRRDSLCVPRRPGRGERRRPAVGLDASLDERGEAARRSARARRRRASRPASSGTMSTASAAWPTTGPTSRAGHAAASSSPARRLRLPAATTVATRSPAPARPAKVSRRAAARARVARRSRRTPCRRRRRRRSGRPRPRRPRRARRRSWRSRELGAGDVGSSVDVDAGALAGRRPSWRAKAASADGEHERGAVRERVRRVAGAGEAGDRAGATALGHVGGGKRSQRRDEALGEDEHAGARRDRARRGRRARPAGRARGRRSTTRSWRRARGRRRASRARRRGARRRAGSGR